MGSLLHAIRLAAPWIALLIAVAFGLPRLWARGFRRVERWLTDIARNSRRSILLCGVLALLMATGTTVLTGVPVPEVHDEFSYLLAADTFAHGRLTNPPHLLWQHFETIHVLTQATTMSKYPTGQGLFMALGERLTGYPIVGVWLSAAAAGAALCWMLYAWLPPRYALLGGILATLHPLFVGWSHSYWGGLVAACGGALTLGGFRRLAGTQPRAGDAWWMGLGIAIMGASRPYEGFVLAVLLLPSLVRHAWRHRVVPFPVWLTRCALPVATMIGLFMLWTAVYDHAVTGNILRLPYMLYTRQYDPVPIFLWQRPGPIPHYRHPYIRDFYLKVVLPHYLEQRSLTGFLLGLADKVGDLILKYGQPLTLLIPLAALPWRARRDHWTRFGLIVSALFLLTMLQGVYLNAHYVGAAACLGYVLLLQGLRQMRCLRWHRRPVGRALVRLVVLASLVYSVGNLVAQAWSYAKYSERGWSHERAHLQAQLQRQGGKHLVIVHYGARHNLHADWVYNEADIDQSPVVWAREMDPASDLALRQYFRARHIWLLNADDAHPRLTPYPLAAESPPRQTR